MKTSKSMKSERHAKPSTVRQKFLVMLLGAAFVSASAWASGLMSEPTFVSLRPGESSFWRTATGESMTLPIEFPEGASAAVLTVTGVRYSKAYEITENTFTLVLPKPTSPSEENVYDLQLAFDDGTVRTARLGLIQGLAADAEGATRCLIPASGYEWNQFFKRAVVPIPAGTTSFTINGESVTTDGFQGWYALQAAQNAELNLSLVADGVPYAVSLVGRGSGFIIMWK